MSNTDQVTLTGAANHSIVTSHLVTLTVDTWPRVGLAVASHSLSQRVCPKRACGTQIGPTQGLPWEFLHWSCVQRKNVGSWGCLHPHFIRMAKVGRKSETTKRSRGERREESQKVPYLVCHGFPARLMGDLSHDIVLPVQGHLSWVSDTQSMESVFIHHPPTHFFCNLQNASLWPSLTQCTVIWAWTFQFG